jgi:hypothetical protein
MKTNAKSSFAIGLLVMANVVAAAIPAKALVQTNPESQQSWYGVCRSPTGGTQGACWCDWTIQMECNTTNDCHWRYPDYCAYYET